MNFLGMQVRINNQFAEFQMAAAVFAELVHRDGQVYLGTAKTAKFLRRHIVYAFFFSVNFKFV